MSQIPTSALVKSNEEINVQSSESSPKTSMLEKLRKLFQLSHIHFSKGQFDEADMLVKQYNKFLESKAPHGYKYKQYDNSDVFIIDMPKPNHSELEAFLITLFGAYNARYTHHDCPFIVGINSYHYSPDGSGVKIAPDVTIRPNEIYVPNPQFPIQLHTPKATRNSQENWLRAMTARLWAQEVEEYQE
ncbi:15726_t:CDS:2, partial [Gigaspora margarita]